MRFWGAEESSFLNISHVTICTKYCRTRVDSELQDMSPGRIYRSNPTGIYKYVSYLQERKRLYPRHLSRIRIIASRKVLESSRESSPGKYLTEVLDAQVLEKVPDVPRESIGCESSVKYRNSSDKYRNALDMYRNPSCKFLGKVLETSRMYRMRVLAVELDRIASGNGSFLD
jgi:hypothetical protein